jgi:hypothetical protein
MSNLDHPTLASLRSSYGQANFIQTKSQLVAFYVKNYIITRAVDTLKTERNQGKDVSELTKEVQAWFQDLESLKKSLGPQIQNQDQSRTQYQDYASYWFMKARSQYQSGTYSQQLADDLSTVILLYDAYNIFNSPSQDIDNNKNFAKTAHQTVLKSLQNNQNTSKYNQTPGNPYQSTPGYNPYQSHQTSGNPNQSTHNQQQSHPDNSPFQGFQVAESTFVPKSSVDQKKSQMNQQNQPIPDNNQGPFQGFQAAESTFVPKSSIDQKKSAMNQPTPDNNQGPFQGFQVAESTFIPKSSLDQRRSQMNQQQPQPQGGQNQPFSTGIVNSVYQQGPPQNFQPYPQQQSGFMPPQNQNFHQSHNPYAGYNPYQQQPPHGFSQGPQGGNFSMPGHGHGPEPTQNINQNQQQGLNQSRNIAQSGINKQGGDQSGVMGLPDFTKFTGEDPMKGQSVNPYQGQPANMGASQKPNYQQNQDLGGNQNPYHGGQSTVNPNNNPYSNPHTGGYDPLASKIGANNAGIGGNPYGGNDKMNLENIGKASVQQPVNNNLQSNIRETVTPQPQVTRGGNVGGKPIVNINVPVDKHSQLKELCLMAISELDYKNVKEAKDDIRRALDIIRQYE